MAYMDIVPLKTVVVGDGAVGKTCMLIRLVRDIFPEEYIPTVFDHESHEGFVGDIPCNLGLWDTGGGEDYPRLRPLSYPGTDVFTLLFSVTGSVAGLERIYEYWWPELKHFAPDVPIVLVASKIDLRHNGIRTINTADGEELAKKINAAKYMEISSKSGQGVTELFDEIIKIGYNHHITAKKKKRKKKCVIL